MATFKRRKKTCYFTDNKVKKIDWKDVDLLKRFVSELMISIVLIVVAGLMITLSIQEMLPRALKYKENKWIYLGLIIGTILVIVNVMIS